MGQNIINLEKCESQHAWEKNKIEWGKRAFFTCKFLDNKRELGWKRAPTIMCMKKTMRGLGFYSKNHNCTHKSEFLC